MTINVALVTSEGLVFGCDSIASTTAYLVDPFALDWPTDQQEQPLKDAKGRPLMSYDQAMIQQVVTNAWGGVTKMCPIHSGNTPVVAVTAGLAKLNERTIKSLCDDFSAKQKRRKNKRLVTVEAVAKEFLSFFRKEYEKHYAESTIPEQYRDGPEFLVGGYGKDDPFPSLFRIKVKENSVDKQFSDGKFGVAWAGQSDAVERLIRGYDGSLRVLVEQQIEKMQESQHRNMTSAMTRILGDVLQQLGAPLPAGVNTELPQREKAQIQWDQYTMMTGYGNLPLQDAIDFVAFLVFLQSGRSKFSYGVATVGGRTHIGVVTKSDGFTMLEEPKLKHRHTGFADDK